MLKIIGIILLLWQPFGRAQEFRYDLPTIFVDHNAPPDAFPIFSGEKATSLVLDANDDEPVLNAAKTFAGDVERVCGHAPSVRSNAESREDSVIIVGTIDRSSLLHRLIAEKAIDVAGVQGKWESALFVTVANPLPGVKSALVIAGSDTRGAVFALFDLSRALGVSPWNWWADVPVQKHSAAYVSKGLYVQEPPSVKYRGIFLNDEDWGLRPWAARKMDKELQNIGPNTYSRIFELLLRLHANTLWPAMHPGSMPFHAIPENARQARKWGVVMGSSHSEALLRNNVGEWDEGRDGPWNYQLNRERMRKYWADGLKKNGLYENLYTVGLRGQHDSGLEATGTPETKARLVEQAVADQRALLKSIVNPDLKQVPQVTWLYKESIDLYRAGMKIPDDVTLGWTDDNYGYIRQLPNAAEQQRSGGSALYYHISYWGAPHDHLWLATTPPALMREELTKAWDHGVQKVWMLNVGDIKPGEEEIDYFMQLAWRLPRVRELTQPQFLDRWFAENFSDSTAHSLAEIQDQYYHLNFIRKPEFMGFNGYTDEVRRTSFNPLAWGDQNKKRLADWAMLVDEVEAVSKRIETKYQNAFYELLEYPVKASDAQNRKFLWADRSYVDQHARDFEAVKEDASRVDSAFDTIRELTARYNGLAEGKWDGMMSWHPRDRRVFESPETAINLATAPEQLPSVWESGESISTTPLEGVSERNHTVSIDAAHFSAQTRTEAEHWQVWPDLGLSHGSVGIAAPGLTERADWLLKPSARDAVDVKRSPTLVYDFTVLEGGDATAVLALLPTFPVDSDQRLRYALSLDDGSPIMLDSAGSEAPHADLTDWSSNVLRNAALQSVPLGRIRPGKHKLTLVYGDPGVVFEHITIEFPGAPPAYPFPPETGQAGVGTAFK